MFALLRRKPSFTESDHDAIARQHPGLLIVAPNYIKVYLGDVDVMTTSYVKTKKMTREDALELIKSQTAKSRHHQLYI